LTSPRLAAAFTRRLDRAPIIALAFFALAGCAKIPFPEEPLPKLNIGPSVILQQVARPLPIRFTSDDTIILQAPFHDDLAFLGVLRVDRSAGTFEFVALSHVGIKLFALTGDRNNVNVAFILPPLESFRKILIGFGFDIARMYLDLIPDPNSKMDIDSNEVEFTDKHSGQTVDYYFGGNPLHLLEKHSGFFNSWRVRYFNYTAESAGLYPRGVVMDNGRYHYRIIVKNRDMEIDR
jgi:hypothetical protein